LFKFAVHVIVVSKHLRFNLSSKEVRSGIKQPVCCVHNMDAKYRKDGMKRCKKQHNIQNDNVDDTNPWKRRGTLKDNLVKTEVCEI